MSLSCIVYLLEIVPSAEVAVLLALLEQLRRTRTKKGNRIRSTGYIRYFTHQSTETIRCTTSVTACQRHSMLVQSHNTH